MHIPHEGYHFLRLVSDRLLKLEGAMRADEFVRIERHLMYGSALG
jgi:hypothetical protein